MAEQVAGWYPDPAGDSTKLRYWDGSRWTEDVTAAPIQSPGQDQQPFTTPAQPAQAAYPAGAQVVEATISNNPDYGQPYGQQPYGQPPVAQNNPLAIASRVCGIIGFASFGFVSIAAIILGIIARKNPVQRGFATVGLVLGIVSIAIYAIIIVLAIILSLSTAYYY